MQSRNKFKRIVCIALAVIMTLSLVSTALILMVNAASSKEIEKELVDLRAQQAELKKQSDALKAEINQNEAETQTLIEKKADIDKQMDMSRQTIENLNAQIQQYSLLIADKQSELEDSLARKRRSMNSTRRGCARWRRPARSPTGRSCSGRGASPICSTRST